MKDAEPHFYHKKKQLNTNYHFSPHT